MSEILDLAATRKHAELSDFAKYLIETAEECDDWLPAHWCLLGSGFSTNGGGIDAVSIGDRDRTSLLTFIGMLESVKADAMAELNRLDDEEY